MSSPLWVFGYGSLIWRPDFESVEQCGAVVTGYARRFWQGSQDHRGVPGAPGRVVTLVPDAAARCEGVARRIATAAVDDSLARLDHREQDGYARVEIALSLADGRQVPGLTWIATEGNPSWLGPAPLEALVRQIAVSAGPSGRNADYVLALAEGLDARGILDPHVRTLAAALTAVGDAPQPSVVSCVGNPSTMP